MVPDGWDLPRAEELCERISVGIVVKPKDYYVPEGQGTRAFRSANVREGYVEDSNWVYISDGGNRKNKKSVLATGDILIVRTGYPGTACVVPPEYAGSNCIDIIFARPDQSKVLPEYLCAFTNSEHGKRQILDGQGGLAQQHFNVGAYKELLLPLPPLREQRKIAEILGTWDRAIEVAEQQLETARTQKRALMQQLLTGTKRFPEFEGQPWKEVRLGDMGAFKKGKGIPKSEAKDTGQYPCVLYGQLYTTYGEIIETTVSHTDIDDGVTSVAHDVLIPASTTTSGIDLAIASCVINKGVRLGGDINIFRRNTNKIDGRFLAHYLSNIRRYEMARFAQGVTIIHLKGSDLLNVLVWVPEIREQVRIAKVIADAQSEIEKLAKKIDSLRTEKKALMQQLLTGKRRVTV
ncbi:restriction endonuclease subunit S [Tropicibacter sp. Alg240-R139]|uniref:restriction endonuclease subunit S n=1 Tax=Tropicibacter sp. Alg240-R139 TaxID=2305991 RepID=UPI0013E0C405|nr:restriction endonuclease subunit S [Tropicibacter sp. Alg240-R139]